MNGPHDGAPMPWSRFYLGSAGVILLITGTAKLFSAFGDAGLLAIRDPVLGIPFGRLMLLAAIAELAIGLVCLFWRRPVFAYTLLVWFSTNVVLYRLGLWLSGWTKPCSCLGNLTDALHIPPQTADTAMKIILAYLFVGSCLNLFGFGRRRTLNAVMAQK